VKAGILSDTHDQRAFAEDALATMEARILEIRPGVTARVELSGDAVLRPGKR
jgi:hypothetical protein